MAKVTLKMIAERCGVSTAVVSACLNGKNKKIGCSPAKAEEIRKAVAEMNYVPSVFARSIRTKEVPIVGAFFHVDSHAWNLYHRYFQSNLMELTFLLNKEDIEVTFIPYHSEAEQLQRLQRAVAMGMIGGVVSNILQNAHRDFCCYLKECGLPHMVMGTPAVKEIYSTSYMTDEFDAAVERLFRKSNLKYCYRVLIRDGKPVFFPMGATVLLNESEEPLAVEEITPLLNDSYFIIPGHEILNYLRYKKFFFPHILLCEQTGEYQPPSPDYDLIVADCMPDRVCYIATVLSNWMKYEEKPEQIHYSAFNSDAIKIYPRLQEDLR